MAVGWVYIVQVFPFVLSPPSKGTFFVATVCASGNVTYVHQVVHLVGGFSALVVTTYLGPRQILEHQYAGRKPNYISGLDSNTALKQW